MNRLLRLRHVESHLKSPPKLGLGFWQNYPDMKWKCWNWALGSQSEHNPSSPAFAFLISAGTAAFCEGTKHWHFSHQLIMQIIPIFMMENIDSLESRLWHHHSPQISPTLIYWGWWSEHNALFLCTRENLSAVHWLVWQEGTLLLL